MDSDDSIFSMILVILVVLVILAILVVSAILIIRLILFIVKELDEEEELAKIRREKLLREEQEESDRVEKLRKLGKGKLEEMILELKEKASPLEEKFQKVDYLLDAYNKVYYETNVRANSEENYIEKPSWFNRKVELIVERQQGKENRKNLMLKLINKTLVNEFGNWEDNPRLNWPIAEEITEKWNGDQNQDFWDVLRTFRNNLIEKLKKYSSRSEEIKEALARLQENSGKLNQTQKNNSL